MKTLYLVRHAKAVKCNSDLPDVVRKLSKKGRNAARKMAKKLKRNGVVPDLLISSPAKRAHETACIFAKTINYPVGTIVIIEALAQEQGASNEAGLLTLVRDVDNQYQSAMIFGLDQQISGFARVLGNDFTEALPSCSVVRFDFRNRSWDKILKARAF